MLMFAIVITLCSKDWSTSLWHHVKMLHTRCHVTGCTKVRKTYIATVWAPIFMRPVVPRVWWIRPWNSYQTSLGSKYMSHTTYLTFLSHKTLPKQTSYSENPCKVKPFIFLALNINTFWCQNSPTLLWTFHSFHTLSSETKEPNILPTWLFPKFGLLLHHPPSSPSSVQVNISQAQLTQYNILFFCHLLHRSEMCWF